MKKQTKRILSCLMVLIMCLTTFAPSLAVLAEGETDSNTLVYHNFDGKTIDTANGGGYGAYNGAKNNGGFAVETGTDAAVVNDQLVVNLITRKLIDIQLFGCGYQDVSRDFVLSFDIQIGSKDMSYGYINFRNESASWVEKQISLNGGKIHLTTGGASAVSADLSTTEMTHVELAFDYNETSGAFTAITLMVAGNKIGTVAIDRASAAVTCIDHFRMFRDNVGTDTTKATLTLDNIRVAYGSVETEQPEEDTENTPVVSHDFDGKTLDTANSGGYGSFGGAKNNGGFAVETGIDAAVVNDQLVANFVTNKYIDLQLFGCGYADIKQSFVLSFDIQIGSEDISYGYINFRNAPSGSWIEKQISLNGGKIHIKGESTVSADLSTEKMTHVEIEFLYNKTASAFTSVALIVDGKEIGTATINVDCIDHFRMFRDNVGTASNKATMTLDNLLVAYGYANRSPEASTTLYHVDFSEEEFKTNAPLGKTVNGVRILNNGSYDAELSGVKNDVLALVGSGGHAFIDMHEGMGAFPTQDLTVTMYVRPIDCLGTDFFFIRTSTSNLSLVKSNGTTLTIGSSSKALSPYRFSCVEIMLPYNRSEMAYTTAKLYVNGEYVGSTAVSDVSAVTFFRLCDIRGAGQGMEMDSFTVSSGCQSLYDSTSTVTEFIGYQTSKVEPDSKGVKRYNARLLALMTDGELEKYQNVGFDVSLEYADGTTSKMPFEEGVCTTVYNAVKSSAGFTTTYTAEMLGGAGIFVLNCENIPFENSAITFTVTTYYTLKGTDTIVKEQTRTFTIDKKEETKVIDVYLIGGQSNAAGSTLHNGMLTDVFENVGYAGQTNKQYLKGSASSNFLYSFSQYQWSVTAGLGQNSECMGPEFGMAEILNDYYTEDNKAIIFKSAAGSTALIAPDDCIFGSWLPRSMWEEGYDPANTTTGLGYQYYTFVNNFANFYWTLKENGYTPRIVGMAWMQGEDDIDLEDQSLYGVALTALINDLREDLYSITGDESVQEMPFVIGKIATTFAKYDNPLVPGFNAIQQSVADTTVNCETIETSDLIIVGADGTILGSDAYHFNYNDSKTLGNRFAQKLMEMNGMEIQ